MGIDVLLYVESAPTSEDLTAAEEYFYVRSGVADRYTPPEAPEGRGWKSLSLDPADDWHPTRVCANLTCRYWGPGYERGDWPGIYGAIRLMQHLFPDATVYYGGDSSDDGLEVTEALLAEYWQHFLGPHGDDYRTGARSNH